MTLYSKFSKIIHTPLKNWTEVWIILEWSVNYFDYFRGEVFFLKIRYILL